MASGMKYIWWVVVTIMGLSIVVSSTMQEWDEVGEDHPPQVPCFFIFGDSLADSGNNNLLITLAKVNYQPYGIDFPHGPTGRFCNGRTTVDIIAELLGFDNYIPPFATANGSEILRGVNYASGSAGILKETGKHLGDCISFGRQLKNHWITVSRISDILGDKNSAKKHLNKCLYWVEMGNNDYINNYFMPQHYPTSLLFTPEQYADFLIQKYSRQILKLYKFGARKLALIGLGQIGCTPNAMSTHGTNGSIACVENMNNAVTFLNAKLKSLVDDFNTNFTDAEFIYVDAHTTTESQNHNSVPAGFEVLTSGCCPVNEIGQCIPSQTPCKNRALYYFWDSFHPSEAANLITAGSIYIKYLTQLVGSFNKSSI
ncbi:GDSL esterase/lipase At1g29670-like [Ziziphus jujuba]|nr:GDSL esterase/lipase At1g29670-like [Ziziphus jujuba]